MSDEWAKTAGKGIDAGRELGQFLAPIVKAPLENAMGIVADKLAYMRWERQQRLMKRAHEFMLEQGIEQPTRAVPMNIAISLMQAASMEEDDVLQDTWARLLVNAIDADSGVDVKRSFVSILSELTPVEVRILHLMHEGSERNPLESFYTYALPDSLMPYPTKVPIPKEVQVVEENVHVALWNLVRLGCICSHAIEQQVVHLVSLTALGRAFVKACTLNPKS
ncbi:MAG: Abi-alpha family protein [Humidesulfovibrio sp.]|uniref:Abi-alpha family protein n=1 Tax=Humidesulfovibrio sp. TaxID=2910988 RepID=UPI00273517A4|nr:Abi-alpha family protein [Humidesulfovibrio sp.]MDP2848364.1 Abi-alpha family protein [Humidesulfovibrio sp.]